MVPLQRLDELLWHLLPDLALPCRQRQDRVQLGYHLQEWCHHLQQLHPALHLSAVIFKP